VSDESAWRHSSRVTERQQDQAVEQFRTLAVDTFNKIGLGDAPRRRVRETPREYAINTIDEVLGQTAHLPGMQQWRGFSARDLANSDDGSIQKVGARIFADSVPAMLASGPGTGPVRLVEMKDESNRPIRRWAGDMPNPWAPFRAPAARAQLSQQLTKLGARKAAGQPYPVRQVTLMSDGSIR